MPDHAKIQGIITACTTPGSARGSCRCTRARAPPQHERGSPKLLTPTWTMLGCGDSISPTCSALPSLVLSGTYVLSCAVPTARNLWLVQPVNLASWHGRHAKRRLHPPPCNSWCVIGFVVRCSVSVQVVDVVMYVRGAACYARCGVLQRRHNFDAFLKRFGKRQPQGLVRHWIRTATRNSKSDYGLCRLTSRMTVWITAKFKAAKNAEKTTPTSEGVVGSLIGETSQSAKQRIRLSDSKVIRKKSDSKNSVIQKRVISKKVDFKKG